MAISTDFPTVEDYRNALPRANRRSGGCRPERRSDSIKTGLVSVITVSYNSYGTIRRTIESIAKQSYPEVEHIIIDGGSSDGTVDLLQELSSHIDHWVSEPDDGISDAFNKGIALAAGEYISIVNSDDWLESDHLLIAVEELNRHNTDFAFGDLVLHGRNGQRVNLFIGEPNYADRIDHYMPYINHPTVVCRSTAFHTVGLFDTRLRTAMDYDWLLRLHRAGGKGTYSSRLLSHMSLEGESDRNFRSALNEMRDISIRHGYPKALAWVRYCFRLVKGNLRRRLERLMPGKIYEHLRKLTNLNYQDVDADK